MNDCIFCKIVSGEIPSKKVYEDDQTFVFHDLEPKAPVHVLIIPKKHIVNLAQMSEENKELIGHTQLVASDMAKKLGIGEAFRVLTSSGRGAGQSVFHLHYHLLGGWNKAPEMEVQPQDL